MSTHLSMWNIVIVVVMLGLPAAFAFGAIRVTLGGPQSIWARMRDRADAISHIATCVVVLAIARVLLPWDVLPPLLWSGALFLTVAGIAATALHWPRMPMVQPGRPAWFRWTSAVISIAVTAAALVLTA